MFVAGHLHIFSSKLILRKKSWQFEVSETMFVWYVFPVVNVAVLTCEICTADDGMQTSMVFQYTGDLYLTRFWQIIGQVFEYVVMNSLTQCL